MYSRKLIKNEQHRRIKLRYRKTGRVVREMREQPKLGLIAALCIAVLAFSMAAKAAMVNGGNAEADAVPGEFLIGVRNIDGALITSIERNGFEVVKRIDQINVLVVKARNDSSVQASMKVLMDSRSVRYVEPNYIVKMTTMKVVEVIEDNGSRFSGGIDLRSTPNDTFWSTDPVFEIGQWDMHVIDADKAWEIEEGSHNVIVAVIDTGIRGTHHDLDANYIPIGYDWVNDDNDPDDDNGHGTHVAGIIAAEINNGYGIAGLAQVSIMAEKVLNEHGYGTVDNLIQGIIHAADSGADILNLSLGTYQYSSALEDAVNYAYDKGCVLVAAAGNDDTDRLHYPAALSKVIAVASTYGEPNDVRAPYSNHGSWITVSAPGGYEGFLVLSTYNQDDYSFAYIYGSSQATPHVSGIAALYKSLHPNATNREIEEAIKRGVEDKGEDGWDELYGYGRINAYKTLSVPLVTFVGGEGEIIHFEVNPDQQGYLLVILVSLALAVLSAAKELLPTDKKL